LERVSNLGILFGNKKIERGIMLKVQLEGNIADIEEYWSEGEKIQDSTSGE